MQMDQLRTYRHNVQAQRNSHNIVRHSHPSGGRVRSVTTERLGGIGAREGCYENERVTADPASNPGISTQESGGFIGSRQSFGDRRRRLCSETRRTPVQMLRVPKRMAGTLRHRETGRMPEMPKHRLPQSATRQWIQRAWECWGIL